jgi:biopolymer transport protein ExbD
MRRFSQRNSLVTLNEINITPLLDLAFVLLIIFILVSGSIKVEQGIDVRLPPGGKPQQQVNPRDVRTVSVTKQGNYLLGNKPMSLSAIEKELVREQRVNPNLMVYIHGDEDSVLKYSVPVMNLLGENNIRFGIATRSPDQP